MKIVIATGGFDPVHSGHIEYFKEAAALGWEPIRTETDTLHWMPVLWMNMLIAAV